LRGASSFQDRFFAVALPPLRPAAFFCAVVPPREELEREVVDRVLEVVDAERERVVPEVDRDREVPDVERLAVLDVDRALLVLEVDRRFAAVVRPPLAPAAFFCAVVPPRLEVERALLVLEVDRRFAAVVRPPLAPAAFFCAVVPPRLEVERDVVREPDVDRARDVVERDEPALDRDFAAVARPPLAPAAFFWAVLPPLADVDRLEVVLDFARLDVARGEAARTREIEASSSVVPSTGASSGSSKGGSCGLSVSK
jgi:hypothetical protein